MTEVVVSSGDRRVLVARPDGSTPGAMSVDLAAALARARDADADACLLPPPGVAGDPLFSVTPAAPLRRIEPQGAEGTWLRAYWHAAHAHAWLGERAAAGAGSFWVEMYRELRRHAADERLPYPLRTSLRETAQRAIGRSKASGESVALRLPRRLLRQPVTVALPATMQAEAEKEAVALGIAGQPLVTIAAAGDDDRFGEAIDLLLSSGCRVVRLGEPGAVGGHAGVVDLAARPDRHRALDTYVLLACEFLLCTTADVQRIAYLTGRPCLAIDAIDPLASYPIRMDGVFTLATAVDLETGQALTPAQMLGEAYLRNPHRYGHRRNSAFQVAAAVREMLAAVRQGWRETAAQARFRVEATAAAEALASKLPRVAAWGADRGFLGEGRLAAWQAEPQVESYVESQS